MKICSKCGKELPLTVEYFLIRKINLDGFSGECKKCRTEYFKKYRKTNKNIISEKDKQWRKKTKDKISKQKKYWQEENKQKMTEYFDQYRKSNRDKCNILHQLYKAKKRELPHTFTFKHWENAKQHFNNLCAYCGQEEPLTQDHFIALKGGGEYSINNIVPVCRRCNCSKNAQDFFTWYPKQSFYSKQREQKILKYLGYKNQKQQLAFF